MLKKPLVVIPTPSALRIRGFKKFPGKIINTHTFDWIYFRQEFLDDGDIRWFEREGLSVKFQCL